MQNLYFYQTPLGEIGIAQNEAAITNLYFPDETLPQIPIQETALLNQAGQELADYFAGNRKYFDLPLAPAGTIFQKAVWQSLTEIPYAATRTYKDIAFKIANPKACRAVGQANNKNPIPILIPCHRVIGSNGSLVGYASGLAIKKYLLELEQKYKNKAI